MIAGTYTLHLYCDNISDEEKHRGGYYDFDDGTKFPEEFVADGKDCYHSVRRMAKKAGWKLNRNNTAICPKCNNLKQPLTSL